MDPLTLVVGALLALVFFALGRVNGLRQAIASGRVPKPPEKPICGCGHGLHEHDLKTNECHAQFKKQMGQFYKQGKLWDKWEWTQCGCRQYTGPRPVEEFFAPPMLPPTEV